MKSRALRDLEKRVQHVEVVLLALENALRDIGISWALIYNLTCIGKTKRLASKLNCYTVPHFSPLALHICLYPQTRPL
jgi:hypothetical protein